MRILGDIKIPNFKFPKFKMEGLEKIEEMKVDVDSRKTWNSKERKEKLWGYYI